MMNSPLSALLARKPKPRVIEELQPAKAPRPATPKQPAFVDLSQPIKHKIRVRRQEARCFRLAALGLSNFEIGKELDLSENTVKVYMNRVRPKYPRALMVAVALRAGTITVADLMAKLREFEAQNGIVPVGEVKA